ncbi:unnamed protein product [Blepharisma stoltei]|uniref:Uncharacterized protein n=1 Tax=Blepharisma stoltei TaxID=1481888 RepID=A0AAU9JP96_9CILI|nr:unnamed protein product [Blepharisma stoltei]
MVQSVILGSITTYITKFLTEAFNTYHPVQQKLVQAYLQVSAMGNVTTYVHLKLNGFFQHFFLLYIQLLLI